MDPRDTSVSSPRPGSWQRAGALLIFSASIALLAAALVAGSHPKSVSTRIMFPSIFLALGVAIALHARFLMLARRQQHETDHALDFSERKYKAMFDNMLDGILILDDRGVCLEANAAAKSILGGPSDELVGRPVFDFLGADSSLTAGWSRFLDRAYDHGQTGVLRENGQTAFLDFTARANFIPRRHAIIVRDISRRKQTEDALRESEERFQQMAANIQEMFWMLDARDRSVLYVNPAYEAITGRSCQSLKEKPRSYEDAIHPEDRVWVLTKLDESIRHGRFNEEFRIVRPDGETRWVWVQGFPVRDREGRVQYLVGTTQDVTVRKLAERQIAHNLDVAEAARAEAEAFRRISLALTQNLSLDYVLETLLRTLLELVPCQSANVILVEAGTRLFLAREAQNGGPDFRIPPLPETFNACDNYFLVNVLATRKSILISDTAQQEKWGQFRGFSHLRSWLCVPLVASSEVLGLLSLGDMRAQTCTSEHLRLAESLAIPAAVAIQNARLYERAEIYGTELERQLADLEMAQQALRLSEEGRTLSEERFMRVFRSSPLPFSITTVDEGRILEINDAFERYFGYSRDGLIGRTVSEVGLWDDPNDRRRLAEETRAHKRLGNMLARLRSASGEGIEAMVSAEEVDLDGRACLLEVFEDLPSTGKLSVPFRSKSVAR
jgi:PAS domain S-box-containing protein